RIIGKTLGLALNHAVQRRLIPFNPAAAVAKPKAQHKEFRVWSAAKSKTFLAAAKDDRLCALYAVAIDGGLRLGELVGLQLAGLDLTTGERNVRRSVEERDKGERRLKEPKSRAGRRKLFLANPPWTPCTSIASACLPKAMPAHTCFAPVAAA